MSWTFMQQHPWQDPLVFAENYASQDMTLLHSGLLEAGARYSYLLCAPLETLTLAHWDEFPPIPADAPPGLPYYIASLGYGLRCDIETLEPGAPSPLTFPLAQFIRYGRMFRFDHQQEAVEEWRMADAGPVAPFATAPMTEHAAPPITALYSNFTREGYETCIADTIAQIEAGNFYQANITRKFFGDFAYAPDYFSLFVRLCALSPAAYACYIRQGGQAIISSSPECFLRIDAGGQISSHPIKGSAARLSDPAADALVQQALRTSPKNLAENLMITDLIRHDLAKVAIPGTVRVTEQSALHSYRTIHHLISTITAQKADGTDAYAVARACFPPGSMTGAPKIAAMRWCATQEKLERGIYSGAIGWFGGGNSCHLNVVIRTLLCEAARFEFQVGGGIVADSTPQDEWRETLTKARAIAQLLGIEEDRLEKL